MPAGHSLGAWQFAPLALRCCLHGLIKVADENGSPAKKETLTVGGKGKEESRRADSRTPKSSRTGSKWAG